MSPWGAMPVGTARCSWALALSQAVLQGRLQPVLVGSSLSGGFQGFSLGFLLYYKNMRLELDGERGTSRRSTQEPSLCRRKLVFLSFLHC